MLCDLAQQICLQALEREQLAGAREALLREDALRVQLLLQQIKLLLFGRDQGVDADGLVLELADLFVELFFAPFLEFLTGLENLALPDLIQRIVDARNQRINGGINNLGRLTLLCNQAIPQGKRFREVGAVDRQVGQQRGVIQGARECRLG